MNTTIYLVRHGDIDNPKDIYYGRLPGFPLNQNGIAQINSLAERIKNENLTISSIYSSPLERAVQTAEILKEKLNCTKEITISEGLSESYIPVLEGHSTKDREDMLTKHEDEYDQYFQSKGNESKNQIITRMWSTFKSVVEENKGRASIIVSHGDPISLLLFKLSNKNYQQIPKITILQRENYPERGEAYKLTVNSNGVLIDKELLQP